MGLIGDLGTGPVALDTVVFIYFIEEHPRFLGAVSPIFEGLDAKRWEGVTSALTLMETLVVPFRPGNLPLAGRYQQILSRGRGLRIVDLDRPLLVAAAQLRARFPVKTPDAIQVAAALSTNCTSFVTNDRDLPRFPGLRIVQLRDYV